jgi:hypothetical protein
VELYTAPPEGSTVICANELGPVIPRTFLAAPGWSQGGHRIKAPLEYSHGPEKTWAYGGLRVADGQAITSGAGIDGCFAMCSVEETRVQDEVQRVVNKVVRLELLPRRTAGGQPAKP